LSPQTHTNFPVPSSTPINDFSPPDLLSNLVGNFVQCLREYTAGKSEPLLPLIPTNLLRHNEV
jgi:hypothetical protein